MSIRIVLGNSSELSVAPPSTQEKIQENLDHSPYLLSSREKNLAEKPHREIRLNRGSSELEYAQNALMWLRTSSGVINLARQPLKPSMVQYLSKLIHNLLSENS